METERALAKRSEAALVPPDLPVGDPHETLLQEVAVICGHLEQLARIALTSKTRAISILLDAFSVRSRTLKPELPQRPSRRNSSGLTREPLAMSSSTETQSHHATTRVELILSGPEGLTDRNEVPSWFYAAYFCLHHVTESIRIFLNKKLTNPGHREKSKNEASKPKVRRIAELSN